MWPLRQGGPSPCCGPFGTLGIILCLLDMTGTAIHRPRSSYGRWWTKSWRSSGRPISYGEKMESWNIPALPPPQSVRRFLESTRLFEGDLLRKPRWNSQVQLQDSNRRIMKGLHTWPDAEIPYTIESTFDEKERLHIARAMSEIEQKSCVRFVPRDGNKNYVYIHKGKDCASNVGKVGGGQPLSLSSRCIHFGIILHEFLHTLGFWHEQSRYDRRKYVDIHWTNIKPLMVTNFFISPYYFMSDVGLPYDYDSLLHYSTNTFARNPKKPTITPKTNGVKIGQRTGLSDMNTESLNMLYECPPKETRVVLNPYDHNLSPYDHNIKMTEYSECLDLWFLCKPLKYSFGCWWGDIVLRRYCRKTCGLC